MADPEAPYHLYNADRDKIYDVWELLSYEEAHDMDLKRKAGGELERITAAREADDKPTLDLEERMDAMNQDSNAHADLILKRCLRISEEEIGSLPNLEFISIVHGLIDMSLTRR